MNHPHYTHPELVQLARFLRVQSNVPAEVRDRVSELVNIRSFTCEQKKYIADHANRWSQRSKIDVRSILTANLASACHDVN